MKKLKVFALAIALAAVCTPAVTKAQMAIAVSPAKQPEKMAEEEEAKVLINRVEEIKEMDKSNLTRAEKKDLRKEVRGIKTHLKAIEKGVYLSFGAIIIIILLLILIL